MDRLTTHTNIIYLPTHKTATPVTMRLRKNGHHLADDIFKCSLLNENLCILIQTSLKGPIDKKSALFQTNGLVPNMHQAIIWTNVGLVYWSIYTSLGVNVLKEPQLNLATTKGAVFLLNSHKTLHFDVWGPLEQGTWHIIHILCIKKNQKRHESNKEHLNSQIIVMIFSQTRLRFQVSLPVLWQTVNQTQETLASKTTFKSMQIS